MGVNPSDGSYIPSGWSYNSFGIGVISLRDGVKISFGVIILLELELILRMGVNSCGMEVNFLRKWKLNSCRIGS